jgi:hypothetical protein
MGWIENHLCYSTAAVISAHYISRPLIDERGEVRDSREGLVLQLFTSYLCKVVFVDKTVNMKLTGSIGLDSDGKGITSRYR